MIQEKIRTEHEQNRQKSVNLKLIIKEEQYIELVIVFVPLTNITKQQRRLSTKKASNVKPSKQRETKEKTKT
jgi:hypothetical protein